MDKLSFAFFGATNYSKELLLFLIEKSFFPKVVFSIPQEFNISYSDKKVKNTNYSNLKEIADIYNIPYYEIDSINGKKTKDYEPIIKELNLDLILVLGWYYMLPKSTRKLSKYGAWGIHASLLPKYAGGAPLNWAIINGEKETGVTLFHMEDGVDDGDIIAQKSFTIEHEDTIKEVYDKATIASKEILLEVLFEDIKNIKFIPQDKSKIEIFPQRKPEDGKIDLSKSSIELYDFIRAQSDPYPGAFIETRDGKKLIIEKARLG
ncbi:methionyl-tRNA formyltransferase [Sulfurospirillum arcachonense]|uniref:methionyl-tRNA formyltransferase n=1 Tax=Sulfurospirillum arcachonense TaxID=57666 RepID=UPI000469B16D|nr:methionyl-tRNA formyltransferase [Sulfurospirillum arcachonense]